MWIVPLYKSEQVWPTFQIGAFQVSFPNLGIIHTSTIDQRGSFIQPLNRTFKININLPKDEYLLPNLIGVVRIRDYAYEDALIIKQKNT